MGWFLLVFVALAWMGDIYGSADPRLTAPIGKGARLGWAVTVVGVALAGGLVAWGILQAILQVLIWLVYHPI